MDKTKLEALIEARGKDFFAIISGGSTLKPSSLYSQATPTNFDGYIKAIYERFEPILRKSKGIGAPDYLLQFMDPRVVTENTMRRGFVPVSDEDDWI